VKKFPLTLIALLTLPISSYADIEDGPVELERIVVSGTKTAKLLNNSPVAVDVVDGDTLQLVTQGTVADALDFIPGVVVTRSAKDGYNIQMQGFDSKRVLVLIDGQPLIAPSGGAVDLDQVSATNIAQIEVIKGAASVMYGSSAMGGVINIITQKGQDDYAKLTYEMGSYLNNTVKESDATPSPEPFSQLIKLNASNTLGALNNQFDLQHIRDTGFDYDETTVSQNAAELTKTFFNLASHTDLDALSVRLKYQYLNESKEKPSSQIPGRSTFIYYRSDVDQHQADLNLDHQDQNWKINARVIQHEETSGQSNSLRNTEIALAEVDGLKVWQFGNLTPKNSKQTGGELVVGFSAHADSLDQIKPKTSSVEINDENRSSFESYAQFNWIKSDYQILAGIRGQEDSDFGFHTASRISGMLNLGPKSTPVQIRMGYGQSYRVPDLKERHYVFDHSNLGYMVLGDQTLTPEQAESINLSLNLRTELFNNSASYFFEFSNHYSETEDLITTVTDKEESEKTNLDISRYANIDNATIYGFDLSNELRFNDYIVQLHYSYLEANDQDDDRLEGRPRHQVKANLGYDFVNYDIQTMLYMVYQADEAKPSSFSDVETDDYTIVNFKVNQQLNDNLNWFISLDNIFNEHSSPTAVKRGVFDPRPVSSRELRIGASYHF